MVDCILTLRSLASTLRALLERVWLVVAVADT